MDFFFPLAWAEEEREGQYQQLGSGGRRGDADSFCAGMAGGPLGGLGDSPVSRFPPQYYTETESASE